MDAAHFVFAPFVGMVRCVERLFVKAPSGRQRVNVLAALNAITLQDIRGWFTHCGYHTDS